MLRFCILSSWKKIFSVKRRARTPLVVQTVIFVTLAVFGCAPKEQSRQPPLILITIDTLRQDYVSCYYEGNVETPNMDWFAKRGVRVENAYSNCPVTAPSHATLLTAMYPMFHGVRENGRYRIPDSVPLVQSHLSRYGYKTAAFVSSFPLESRFGFSRGFDVFDDDFASDSPGRAVSRTWQGHKVSAFERSAENTNRRAIKWLKKNKRKKFFLWIHYFDPHTPYKPPSPFKEKYRGSPYAGEVAHTDYAIGELKRSLEEFGLLDTICIILAGDHGEAFGERVEYKGRPGGHGLTLYGEELRVPLIFYCPPLLASGRVVREPMKLMDIFPTVLDVLGIGPLPGSHGKSFARYFLTADPPAPGNASAKTQNSHYLYSETFQPNRFGKSELLSVSSNKWKYILVPKEDKEILFDLEHDPGEEENVAETNQATVSELKRELEKFSKNYFNLENNFKSSMDVDEEMKAKMRALGYLQ